MKKTFILILSAVLLSATGASAEIDTEIENYTRYTDYEPQLVEPIGLIEGGNNKVLVAWFSRVGNTVFEPDVDAVTTATLQYDSNGELLGNAQMAAGWIAEETGADVFPIQTAYTYPSDYDQTVSVGEGQDIDFVDLRLATHLDDVSGYDTVFLVAPIWHYTVCTPLRAFLEETDFSGKTIYVFTTHCGSRFADTMEKIQTMQPNAKVVQGVAISGFRPNESENEVREFVKAVMK
jgi:flavodoxin